MMADSQGTNDNQQLEERVIKVISRIRKNRSRPCFQNILSFMNREGTDLTMDDLKIVLNNLISRDAVVNKGTDDHDSFYVLEKEISSETDALKIHIESNTEIENIVSDKFYDTLTNKIKLEVKTAVDLLIDSNIFSNINSHNNTSCTSELQAVDNEPLITALQSEIEFLRKEISSKDTIIKLLLNDKNKLVDLKDNERSDKKYDVNKKHKLNKSNTHNNDNSNVREKRSVQNINGNNISSENKKDGSDDDATSDDENFQKATPKKITKRNITILGDSLIKDIKAFKMKQGLSSKEKVFIKSFAGAKNECMSDYITPSLKYKPDVIILHCGTNDLRSEKSTEDIATEIINLAKRMKSDNNDIIISGLVERNDILNDKGREVNNLLKSRCSEHVFLFCDNSNISKKFHLNGSGLHLNTNGTTTLANNFLKCLKF